MTPRWTPPFPRIGSKRAHAEQIATWLEVIDAEVICIPYGGLMGELAAYTGPADIILGETDPGIRAVWEAARTHGLASRRAAALRRWEVALMCHGENPRSAFRSLRKMESRDPQQTHYRASVCTMLGGTSIDGVWRRNLSGQLNMLCPSWTTAETLETRLPSHDAMVAADEWMRGRHERTKRKGKFTLATDANEVFSEAFKARVKKGKRVALIVDPPFGSEAKSVYCGGWGIGSDYFVRGTVSECIDQGIHVCAFTSAAEVGLWKQRLPNMLWDECSTSKRRTGARTSKPYWMGCTPVEGAVRAADVWWEEGRGAGWNQGCSAGLAAKFGVSEPLPPEAA